MDLVFWNPAKFSRFSEISNISGNLETLETSKASGFQGSRNLSNYLMVSRPLKCYESLCRRNTFWNLYILHMYTFLSRIIHFQEPTLIGLGYLLSKFCTSASVGNVNRFMCWDETFVPFCKRMIRFRSMFLTTPFLRYFEYQQAIRIAHLCFLNDWSTLTSSALTFFIRWNKRFEISKSRPDLHRLKKRFIHKQTIYRNI